MISFSIIHNLQGKYPARGQRSGCFRDKHLENTMRKMVTFYSFVMLFAAIGILNAQTISLPDTTAVPGSTILIPVYTTNVSLTQNIQAFQMNISYDAAVAAASAYSTTGTIVPASWFSLYNLTAPGIINGGAFLTAATPYLSGAGNLAWFTFNIPANATGTTALTFNSFVYNETPFPTVNGSITIETVLVAVNGFAYLQGQTNHAGIEVEFEAVAGGASAQTVTTSDGSYELDVEPGTYDVYFSYPGFQDVMLDNQVLNTATTLPTVTLNALPSVTISGFCYLDNQTNHAGSMVVFEAFSGTAVSDTTYTVTSGAYSATLFPGNYNVYYYHENYEPEWILDIALTTSQTLPQVSLSPIPPTITVSIPDTTVQGGESFILPVYVTYVSPFVFVNSFSMQINFDETVIVPEAPYFSVDGTIIPAAGWETAFETTVPGQINGGSLTIDPLNVMYGQGVLINFYMNAVAAASSTTDVHFAFFMFNQGVPSAVTVDGSVEVEVGVNDPTQGNAPKNFALNQNYPNPFNPETNLSFDLPYETALNLSVYNVLGEAVAVVYDGTLNAGSYNMLWNADHLPSGLYFFRLTAGDFTDTKKMLLLE